MALDLARACTAALRPFSAPAKAVEAALVPSPSVRTLCALAGVSRATVYAHQRAIIADAGDRVLCQLIDGQYTNRPFYGTRRMALFLKSRGHTVNRKRVQRLMRGMGLAAMAPGPNTIRVSTHPAHKIYPYLLRGAAITRPNQVWSTDITYNRLNHGIAYLVAVMDYWYSRRVLAWRLSNSDQGSQFTSVAFTDVLKANAIVIAISMDGRGRALNHLCNIFVVRLWRTVKYEAVYLKGYATMAELLMG